MFVLFAKHSNFGFKLFEIVWVTDSKFSNYGYGYS